jgi:chloramphenicol 3-O-phosphotransferase
MHPTDRAVYLITGIQAAGKSTVAQALAQRLPSCVHVRGDIFRRMVVSGRAEMEPNPSAEALRQLKLRYALAATVTDAYAAAGFGVVVQDIVLGEDLTGMVNAIGSRPLHVVVLAPSATTVATREAARAKKAYGTWTIAQLDDVLRRQTPRIGLWLDTSHQTPDETVEDILTRRGESAVD